LFWADGTSLDTWDFLFAEDKIIRVRILPTSFTKAWVAVILYIVAMGWLSADYPNLVSSDFSLVGVILTVLLLVGPFFGFMLFWAVALQRARKKVRLLNFESLMKSGKQMQSIPYSDIVSLKRRRVPMDRLKIKTRVRRYDAAISRKNFETLKTFLEGKVPVGTI